MSAHPEHVEPFAFSAPLSVCVDVKHPHTYLALEPVQRLADELDIAVDWLPFPAAALKAPPESGDDRGSRHRRIRARYLEADIQRYADAAGLTVRGIYRNPDSTLACLALQWLRDRAPEMRTEYLRRLCAGYWAERRELDSLDALRALLVTLGQDADEFAAFASGGGPAALADLRTRLVAAGVFTVPSLVVDGQVFVGRAHLPMARWLLTGRSGPPPV